jgi:hypothetical protein
LLFPARRGEDRADEADARPERLRALADFRAAVRAFVRARAGAAAVRLVAVFRRAVPAVFRFAITLFPFARGASTTEAYLDSFR